MRASTKRFIWFFGFNLLMLFSEYFEFLINGKGWDWDVFFTLSFFGLMIAPLFFFEDDSKNPQKARRKKL